MSIDNVDLTVPRMYTRAELDEAVGEALRRVARELELHDLGQHARHVQRVADSLGVILPREVTLAELTRLLGRSALEQLAVLRWTGEKDPNRTWSQPEVDLLIDAWRAEAYEAFAALDDPEAAQRVVAHVRRRAIKGGRA